MRQWDKYVYTTQCITGTQWQPCQWKFEFWNCKHTEKFTVLKTTGPETTEGRVESLLLFEIKFTIQVDGILRNTLMLVSRQLFVLLWHDAAQHHTMISRTEWGCYNGLVPCYVLCIFSASNSTTLSLDGSGVEKNFQLQKLVPWIYDLMQLRLSPVVR
jgi:hypothetical protein